MQRRRFGLLSSALLAATALPARAQRKYDTGASDSEIRLGQTMPYSGPLSAYGAEGKVQLAYFRMLNDKGGINGRKLLLSSLDDGYQPTKTVEQTRKLVESDEVLAMVGSIGTAQNAAVQKYLNTQKVPQLAAVTGYSKIIDPDGAPWTTSFLPSYHAEGKIYAKYLLQNRPEARIGTLTQNDELGRDYLRGLLEGLADKAAKMVVKQTTYDPTDTTVDSQVLSMQAAGADTLFLGAIGKFPGQALRKMIDIGWKPTVLMFSAGNSVKNSLEPSGNLERLVGILSSVWLKTPGESQWAADKGMLAYLGFMQKYLPETNALDLLPALGYTTAQLIAYILQQCGDDLTRENIIRRATALRGVSADLLLPGITFNSSARSRNPTTQLQMARFDGKAWAAFGPVLDANETPR